METMVTNRAVRGFTLVELLVAMALGLFIMVGVLSVFVSSSQSYAQQDALGQMQENARFALEMLTRDTRMSGFAACSSNTSVANTVQNSPNMAENFTDGITGYLGDAALLAALGIVSEPNTDAILIHTVNSNNAFIVTNHNIATATLTVNSNGNSTLTQGDIVLLSDANCTNMSIYVHTTNGTNAIRSDHNTGPVAGLVHSNCTEALKGNFDCTDTTQSLALAYSPGSSAYRIESIVYYIAPSTQDANILSLYRQNVNVNPAVVEEVVEGITDLDIFYGLRVGNTVQYLRADGITAANWANVQSVRYNVTVRSLSTVAGNPVTQTFTATIQLRNRG